MSNYGNVDGLSYSMWDGEGPDAVLEQDGCEIEEFYYDEDRGNLVLTFIDNNHPDTWVRSLDNGGHIKINRVCSDKDTTRLHAIDIPVKASTKWEEFVKSLPMKVTPDQ